MKPEEKKEIIVLDQGIDQMNMGPEALCCGIIFMPN